MTVYANKPAFNVREKLKELEKPSGVAGRAMLAADTPQEQFNLIGAGRRNLLINGGFDVWQRNGTSVVDSSNGPYNYITADRWVTYYNGTYAQIEDTLPTGKIVKTMRYTVGAAGNAPNFNQAVENGGKIMAGQTATMSWWMKASKSATIKSRLPNTASGVFAGGSSAYNLTVTTVEAHRVTTEWTYHTATKTFPSTMSHANVHFELWGTNTEWSTSDTFQMANCQLEFGKVATPFEHRSYGEELALCKRYLQVYDTLGSGVWNSATSFFSSTSLPVSMRVVPTITLKSGTYTNINIEHVDTYDITGVSPGHASNAGDNETWEVSTFITVMSVTNARTVGDAGVPVCDRNEDYFILTAEL